MQPPHKMKFRSMRSITVIAGVALVCVTVVPASAATVHHETRFSVKFGGIEIGQAGFRISFDDHTYTLKGSGKTTGLAEWFSDGRGEVESFGDIIANVAKPKIHRVSVTESKKTESLELAFAGEKVDKIKIESSKPKKKRVAPKYVPVEAGHLSAVLDPASSMIIPMSGSDAADPAKVCNQIFPIFDGETRYDIRLSYKSTKPVDTDGYNGWAHVCKMRYVPVAGHKKNHRSVQEMAANKHMEIWLAPMGGVSVFTPIRIVVGTKYGRFVADPMRFSSVSDD